MVIHIGNKYSTINKLLRTRRIIPYFLAANILMLLCTGWVPGAQATQTLMLNTPEHTPASPPAEAP